MEKCVYVVVEEWQNDGEGGTETHVYSTYEGAKQCFDTLVKKDMEDGLSSDSFKCDDVETDPDAWDTTDKNYVLEKEDSIGNIRMPHYWRWYEQGDYDGCHSEYTLMIKVLDEPIQTY